MKTSSTSTSHPRPGPARAGGIPLPLLAWALLPLSLAVSPSQGQGPPASTWQAATPAPWGPQAEAVPHFLRFPRHGLPPMGTIRETALAFGDLNGNGHMDMAMPDHGAGNGLRLAFNRGDGTFVATHLPMDLAGAMVGGIGAVVLGDLNGNGHLDIVAGGVLGFPNPPPLFETYVFLNDGRGNFTQAPRGQRFPNQPQHPRAALALADVTGNGAPDLYVGTLAGHPSYLYLNDGNGFFQDASVTHLPALFDTVARAVFADLTGNGYPDLILAHGRSGSAETNRVLLNDGTGRFLTGAPLLPTDANFTTTVAVGDLTGNGLPDLVFGNATFQDRLYLNQGSGIFVDATHRLPRDWDWTHSLAIGDLNGNGHLDIVAGHGPAPAPNRGPPGVRIYLNDGTGHFPTARRDLLLNSGSPTTAWIVALADFDGDGDLDIYTRGPGNTIYMNLTRHLHTQETVSIRAPVNLTLYGAEEQFFVPALALQPANLPLPGLGTLGLDPGSLVTLPPVMIPRGKFLTSTQFHLPADPALQNRILYSQALVLDLKNPANTRLTNWLADEIQ